MDLHLTELLVRKLQFISMKNATTESRFNFQVRKKQDDANMLSKEASLIMDTKMRRRSTCQSLPKFILSFLLTGTVLTEPCVVRNWSWAERPFSEIQSYCTHVLQSEDKPNSRITPAGYSSRSYLKTFHHV